MLNKKRISLSKISKSFIIILNEILSSGLYHDIIHWDSNGKGIIISNIDKLCEIVLPKYYKHNNYSSFVRQLNMYGFHKTKEKIKDVDIFEHQEFNKQSTKEQINKITKQKNRMKILSNYINKHKNEFIDNDKDELYINNSDVILKYILDKNDENTKTLFNMKNEFQELKDKNKKLKKELLSIKNKLFGHNILLKKIIEKKSKNKNINLKKKSENIKELLKRYLYYLHIYSPFVSITNQNKNIYKIDKISSFLIENLKDNKNEIYNTNNIDSNHSFGDGVFYDEFPIINNSNNFIKILDINYLYNNSSSNSFYYKNKDLNNQHFK